MVLHKVTVRKVFFRCVLKASKVEAHFVDQSDRQMDLFRHQKDRLFRFVLEVDHQPILDLNNLINWIKLTKFNR